MVSYDAYGLRHNDPDEPEGFDVAQICLNGHMVNSSTIDYPLHSKDFCSRCGKQTIAACQQCKKPIQGCQRTVDVEPEVPAFCHGCGVAYPWTQANLEAAQELTSELEGLSEEEKKLLASSIDDIVHEGPKTAVAVTRFKKLIAKVRGPAAESFKKIIVDVASEVAKKALFPNP